MQYRSLTHLIFIVRELFEVIFYQPGVRKVRALSYWDNFTTWHFYYSGELLVYSHECTYTKRYNC